MTRGKKLQILRAMFNDDNVDTELLLAYLDIAEEKILNKCYPYRTCEKELPEKYHTLQIEIANYLLCKRGAEGETAHSENGINRSYESASVPDSMLKGIVPFASIFPRDES